nr:hypothetical protein [uncultured Draconibacterium sp.]
MGNSENNIKAKVFKATITLLQLIVLVALAVTIFYNTRLQEQVYERDIIIEQLSQRDSILSKIMEIEYDSIAGTISYTYSSQNGKVLKYNDLNEQLDIFKDKYNIAINELQRFSEEYNNLIKDYNLLAEEYYNATDTLAMYESLTGLLESVYSVHYELSHNENTRTVRVIAPKVDSALILLPYFRDRLKKDKDKWIIRH